MHIQEPNNDEIIKTLTRVIDYVRWGTSRFNEANLFYGHGTDNAWDESLYLVLHALHLPYSIDQRIFDSVLSKRERQIILTLFETRIHDRLPAAYITGSMQFAGLSFKVDERVLIPRSPIAELIENQFQPWLDCDSALRILDLCTGSGCIGIACAAHLGADVVLSDISAEALQLAGQNTQQHALEDQVELLESDLFEKLEGQFDLIVSNPPYVDAQDFASMPAEYRHEPELGLTSGADGLDCARKILSQAANFLNEEGILVLEVGNSWQALEAAFPHVPFLWLEFERGGHGVCLFTREQLASYFS